MPSVFVVSFSGTHWLLSEALSRLTMALTAGLYPKMGSCCAWATVCPTSRLIGHKLDTIPWLEAWPLMISVDIACAMIISRTEGYAFAKSWLVGFLASQSCVPWSRAPDAQSQALV